MTFLNILACLYESTIRVIAVTMVLASVKVFKRLYLLNPWMEEVHTCPDVSYWFEALCCTIPMHMSDLLVKVNDLEKICVKVFGGKA